MRLKYIELDDFRGFGQARFDLMEPGGQAAHRAIVLVGTSGSGKTAVMQAIAGFFGGLINSGGTLHSGNWSDLCSAEALTHEDVRQGAVLAQIRIGWSDVLFPDLDCRGYLGHYPEISPAEYPMEKIL